MNIKKHLYRLNQYGFKAPSVCSYYWTEDDWIAITTHWFVMDDFGYLVRANP
jgi:hypothetical protein